MITWAASLSGFTFHPFFSAIFSAFSKVLVLSLPDLIQILNCYENQASFLFVSAQIINLALTLNELRTFWTIFEMKKQFESEIRINIKNQQQFLQKLESLQAKVTYEYQFIDHIYLPINPVSDWNLNRKIMRIREHIYPEKYALILFTENERIQGKKFQFKQSRYPMGKLELFKGNLETAQSLLSSWDFQLRFQVEKTRGKLFEITQPLKFILAFEHIAQLGYSVEIEAWGADLTEIEQKFSQILSLLDIPLENASSNTLPFIVAAHLHL